MKNRKLLAPLLTLGVLSLGTVPLFAAVTESSTNVPLAIPDNGNVDSTLNFSVNGTITDANLTVDVVHTWADDIELRLTSPSVAVQLLFQDCGGSGDNFQATLDQDAAGLAACTPGANVTGTFQPTNGSAAAPVAATGNLDAFNGSASGGVWTLNVADDSAICTGTLNAWSLTLDGSAPLPVELMNFEVD